jgi:hypothetical protein
MDRQTARFVRPGGAARIGMQAVAAARAPAPAAALRHAH